MNSIQKEAAIILHEAEDSLRKLMEKGLAEQRYGEIKDVIDLADGIAKLIRGEATSTQRISIPAPPVGYEGSEPPPPPPTPKPKTTRMATKKSQYPWFGRNGDRLVKVGWSKKNKKEYEHRVQREAVLTFVQHLADQVTEGVVFDVEGLLPVTDASGEEVPAYQVYVTLAWLRETDVIEKKGRDGYVLRDKELLRGKFDELWNSLRTRAA